MFFVVLLPENSDFQVYEHTKITKTFLFQVTYTIKLPQFEGPFDLLLFFIERDELDIYDIPVFKITNDFLEYIRHL